MPRSQQLALPLGQIEVPEHLLREAYRRSRLQQSFEEAMQLQHFRIGLRRMAMVMAAKGRKQR